MAHTQCVQRQTKMRQAREVVHTTLHTHAFTPRLHAQALADWHTWATRQVHAFR